MEKKNKLDVRNEIMQKAKLRKELSLELEKMKN